MYDQNPSPASSTSPSAAVGRSRRYHCRRRHMVEEDEGDSVACTGESCQSCTAWVIADCVALCCCPCAVVNLLTLTFLKLPWTVARRFIRRRKKEKIRKIMDKERRCGAGGDTDGISRKERVNECTSGIVWEEGETDNPAAAEEIWLELYEVGHLAFGRVSFSGNILNG
ncbi:uncharacterized protein [Primulina huaijiensis]|uniref:uncharacterized protein n=1 Tax=Primulina huaijiensis TaxID=1492673 RepID=UPI003CC6E39F